MPRSAASTGALTTFTTWSTRSWNVPLSAAAVSRRVSYCESGPCAATVIRCGRPRGELDRDPPEQGGKRDERPQDLEVSLVDDGDVHGVRDDPAVERGDDLLGHDHARAVLRLAGRRREVRRDDDLVEPQQRPLVRLLREDVESGAGELARLDRLGERRLVDERAAGGVHETRPVPHVGDGVAIDQAARLVREGRVERDDVGRREEILHALRLLDAEVAEAVLPTNGS